MSYATDHETAVDQGFVYRVMMAALKAAFDISSEADTTDRHAQRAAFACEVVSNPTYWGPVIALGAAAGGTVTGASEDQDLLDRIAGIWNAYLTA